MHCGVIGNNKKMSHRYNIVPSSISSAKFFCSFHSVVQIRQNLFQIAAAGTREPWVYEREAVKQKCVGNSGLERGNTEKLQLEEHIKIKSS